ncbi:MAG: UDP-N-acetylglucosamine 2-epimerase (non-hydrolyzing) [Gemmatimonadetes bacterium]|nr:UDP-N-acetylglucosamine 2-epimerase (non-hydrolyzing) [Gemmatimonadota bacterium]
MRALVVVGARPNFMKVAPVLAALRGAGWEALLLHTGQHYDAAMSDAFFADLSIPPPDFHLGVGSASHASQTARIMEAFEPVLLATRPDWLVVVGDVNSTLACALVAAKLKEETGCRTAHVEAGLRSHDWRMPEEVNRVLTDRLSDLLLTPGPDALPNLLAEGIPANRVAFVGNVMIDTLFAQLSRARAADVPGRLGVERGRYALVTLHRPSNVDDPAALENVLEALAAVAEEMPVVFPVHPRTRRRAEAAGLHAHLARLCVLEPLGYRDMLSLTDGAAVVLTDSGGLQEETTALGVPCVTLRERTERPVTITHGTNRLAPFPLTPSGVYGAFREALAAGRAEPGSRCPAGWDGRAAERIVHAMESASTPGRPPRRLTVADFVS